MPCDTVRDPNQTLEDRNNQVKAALRRLEAALKNGTVRVSIGPSGGVAFVGWKDRDDVTDVCAYRTLTAEGSWELRQAVTKAEAMTGRKVNPNAVASGHHSHDGGNTWHKGH